MKHIELEQRIRNYIKRRRILWGFLLAFFFIIIITFFTLYMQSGEVEEIDIGPIKYKTVTYNYSFSWGILAGTLCFVPLFVTFIFEIIFTKLQTFEVNCEFVTFYRGIVYTKLYVNGEEKVSTFGGYYLETSLSDGTRVNVALGKWSARITFSNDYPSIEI